MRIKYNIWIIASNNICYKSAYPLICMLFILQSCSTLQKNKSEIPSWVQGIRNGTESLKVVNGNRILYRRVLKAKDESEQSICTAVLDLASKDIQAEFVADTKIPYTLEYLHYDESNQDCSVTLSISSQISTRLLEIKEIKKNYNEIVSALEDKWKKARIEKEKIEKRNNDLEIYIRQNQHLLKKYNDQVGSINEAYAMLKNRKERAIASAFTGLSKRQFTKIVSHEIEIIYTSETRCWEQFKSSYVSYHGPIVVCWTDNVDRKAFLKGFCDTEKGNCWVKNI